jgi:hypothetical protein
MSTFRLQLVIGPDTYVIVPVRSLPDGTTASWRIHRPDGALYYCDYSHGLFKCTCDGFRFHKECKHARAIAKCCHLFGGYA